MVFSGLLLHYDAQVLFHCCRRLQRMGLTKQEIAQKVEERKAWLADPKGPKGAAKGLWWLYTS